MPQTDDSKIAAAAYLIWLDEGQPHGQDEEHWQRARLAFSAETTKKRARKTAPKAAADKTGTPAMSKTAVPKAKAAAKPRTPRKIKAAE